MACLFKRGKKYWISFRINGQLTQRSLKTDNPRIAKEKFKQIEYELSIGDMRQVSRTPLVKVLEEFCKYLQTTRPAKSCYNVYNRLRAVFGPVCDSLQPRQPGSPKRRLYRVQKNDKFAGRHLNAKILEDITPAVINRWLDARAQEEDWSPKTVNNYRQTIHRLFSYAIKRHDFISRDRRYPNPAAGVDRRKEPASEIRFLTLDQIDVLLEALKEHPLFHAMVATYIYAGLRREEALWLTNDDVDLDNRLLRIRAKTIDGEFWQPKTKRNRVVPISNALFDILSNYERPFTNSLWFFTSPEGLQWDPDNFSRDLRAVTHSQGLTWTCLDFRHTFGSQLAQKGETLYKISMLMGNSPEICRKHYAALIPEEMTDVVEFGQPKQQVPSPPPPPNDTAATKEMLEMILAKLDNQADDRPYPRLRVVGAN